VGFENDPIYKLLENYSDRASSLDNHVLATAEYMPEITTGSNHLITTHTAQALWSDSSFVNIRSQAPES
jgi:hypothetical protein